MLCLTQAATNPAVINEYKAPVVACAERPKVRRNYPQTADRSLTTPVGYTRYAAACRCWLSSTSQDPCYGDHLISRPTKIFVGLFSSQLFLRELEPQINSFISSLCRQHLPSMAARLMGRPLHQSINCDARRRQEPCGGEHGFPMAGSGAMASCRPADMLDDGKSKSTPLFPRIFGVLERFEALD